MKNKQIRLTLFTLMIMSSVACTHTPLTPSQTVQHFWSAVIDGDSERALKYMNESKDVSIDSLQSEVSDKEISFGKVSIQSEQAKVETTIASTTKELTVFTTVLEKEQELWKVNYLATKKSLDQSKEKKGLGKLVDDLRKLGKSFSGQLDGVIKNWEQATPKLKQDLEDLGESVQKQIQDSVDKHGPELQKNLQEFTESLDEALKELDKEDSPKEKQSDEAGETKPRMI